LPRDNHILNFLDAEASIVDAELNEPRDEFLFHELASADRKYDIFQSFLNFQWKHFLKAKKFNVNVNLQISLFKLMLLKVSFSLHTYLPK
jgi:hypothetical protein